MKKSVLAGLAVIAMSLAFVAGAWTGWRSASVAAPRPQPRTVARYVCPMHPQYHSDRPGQCPSCGMPLELATGIDQPGTRDGRPAPPGAVSVSGERQQLIGVRTAVAGVSAVNRTIRTVGRVEVDEDRVYRLEATVGGVVRDLRPNSAGRFVQEDEVLLTYYSTEFLTAQQAFYYALGTRDRVGGDAKEPSEQMILTNAQLRSSVDALRNLGMSDTQIAELAKTRKLVREVELRSPVGGYVLSRTVFPKQRLERGEELYRIADLAHVWVLADVFEGDAAYVRPGTRARLTFGTQPGATIQTKISSVLPQFDRTTRTLKVRLEIDNPRMALRPDMFVNVEIEVNLPAALTVPLEAVVDSGTRKLVFVDRGGGYFEPRRVETGSRADDRVEIVRGLAAGERIVVSGNFLLDSESRMRLAGTDRAGMERDPVCGMTVDPARAEAARLTAAYQGRTEFFCSEGCRKAFNANPAKYAPPPGVPAAAPTPAEALDRPSARSSGAGRALPDFLRSGDDALNTTLAAAQGRTVFAVDPVCGADVDTTASGVLKSTHNGRPYYFISPECKAEFDKDPAKHAGGK
jgi:membrane fusion protein, copper/silver efflux system